MIRQSHAITAADLDEVCGRDSFPKVEGPAMPNTRGASSVEYGLLASLIAGVIISVVLVLGPKVADLFVLAWP
ncbi:hypothetical protein GCM10028801_19060 [Nocardioides maradonensis]